MVKVIGVCFRKGNKIYDFKLGDELINKRDIVIVETVEGIEAGKVMYVDKDIKDRKDFSSLKTILRKANKRDLKKISDFEQKKPEALKVFDKKIKINNLPMKPVDVDFSFDNLVVTFFFIAESRVDFRELVKDLARHFKKQIILRQIGPRDVAKVQGGFGVCGEPLCCNRFLQDLGNVVMDMVRDQDLEFRGSEKLSGVCGRLKCCLAFEEDEYNKLRKNMPELGTEVKTKEVEGVVVGRNILKQIAEIELKNQVKVRAPVSELKILKIPKKEDK
jgi:cell fate regulator YaaT (PSP1 superfamily)